MDLRRFQLRHVHRIRVKRTRCQTCDLTVNAFCRIAHSHRTCGAVGGGNRRIVCTQRAVTCHT